MAIEIFSKNARPDIYDRAVACPHPDGYIIIDDHEAAVTKQCVHCGRHWIWQKGSGKKRGWCTRCNGITCGKRECDPCVHFLQKLDEYEKGTRKSLV